MRACKGATPDCTGLGAACEQANWFFAGAQQGLPLESSNALNTTAKAGSPAALRSDCGTSVKLEPPMSDDVSETGEMLNVAPCSVGAGDAAVIQGAERLRQYLRALPVSGVSDIPEALDDGFGLDDAVEKAQEAVEPIGRSAQNAATVVADRTSSTRAALVGHRQARGSCCGFSEGDGGLGFPSGREKIFDRTTRPIKEKANARRTAVRFGNESDSPCMPAGFRQPGANFSRHARFSRLY